MKKYILALSLVASLTACDDYLTVTPPSEPTGESLSPEYADENMSALYNGALYVLTTWFNSYGYNGYRGTLLTVDALGGDMIGTSGIYGGVVTQYNFKTNDPLGTNVDMTWKKYFQTISNVNKALVFYNKLPNPSKTSQAQYAQLIALRAMCYLDIVRLWQMPYELGASLPVAPNMNGITDVEEIKAGVPLSTVAELYEVLIDDLLEAKELLSNLDVKKTSFGQMDADVVSMFLARAYLTRGTQKVGGVKADMDAAIEHAASIRANEKYTLMGQNDFSGGFNDAGNPEFMWGLPQTSSNSSMSYVFNYLDTRHNDTRAYYKNAVVDPYFIKMFDYGAGFDSLDCRFGLFEYSAEGAPRVQNILTYNKFHFRDSEKTADIVYMRAAEAWLIEAEAKLRGGEGGSSQSAEEIVNELRAKRGATTTGYTVDVDFVLKERRREVWGEGVAGLFDLTRTQSVLERKPLDVADFPQYPGIKGGHYTLVFPDKSPFVANSPYYFFQIPEQEIVNNPAVDGLLPRL